MPGGRTAPNPLVFAEFEIPPCLQRFRTGTSNLNPADFEACAAACRRRFRLSNPNDHDSVNRATAVAGEHPFGPPPPPHTGPTPAPPPGTPPHGGGGNRPTTPARAGV